MRVSSILSAGKQTKQIANSDISLIPAHEVELALEKSKENRGKYYKSS